MSKVHVITGGGSGIGKAIAEMLPKEDTVIISGRTASKLAETAAELNAKGHNIVAMGCDVTKREDVRKLAEDAAQLGEIDKVFNCAGISGGQGDRETIYRINALGTIYVNQEFYKVMNGGVICDIASDSGYMLPKFMMPSEKVFYLAMDDEEAFLQKLIKKAKISKVELKNSNVAYLISKNFVRWYTGKCAYKYMAQKNIRVFSVSPGFVNTPMTAAEAGQSDATLCMLSYSPLERAAEPEELAYLITALADDRCSYFLGADVLCDGGVINNGYGVRTARKRYDKQGLNEKW